MTAACSVQAAESWDDLLQRCASSVHPNTMMAVIKTESAGKPFAINVNSAPGLVSQPRTLDEAIETAQWLLANGHNFDAGLAQINNANWQWLGLTPENAFDPCTNLTAAATVLVHDYGIAQRASQIEGGDPLLTALSRYNTGNNYRGFNNGYVSRVRLAAGLPAAALPAPVVVQAIAKTPPEPPVAAPVGPATDVFGGAVRTDVFGVPIGFDRTDIFPTSAVGEVP